MMNTIVVPVDFSPVSMNAVHYAAKLAQTIQGSLVLFNAYQIPMTFTEVPVVTIGVDELKGVSESRLSELRDSILHITSGRIKIFCESSLGDVVEELEKLCSRLKPLFVTMGTTGHGSLHNLFVGSNTLRAIQRLETPTIVVPPGATFRVPKSIALATDMETVVESVPAETILSIAGLFKSDLHVIYINDTRVDIRDPVHNESLLLNNLLSSLKPEYHFIRGDDVVDSIQEFTEVNDISWLIVVPKRHRGFVDLLHKSVSKDLAYQSRIPLVCLHA